MSERRGSGIGRGASVAAVLLAGLTGVAAAGEASLEHPDPETRRQLEAEGARIYRIACRACHGAAGDGNGPMARSLNPRPRDFRYGEFKIRSTPSGEPPTGRDLFDVITRGMPGTRMPGWPQLTDRERWALVHYVRAFDEFAGEEPPPKRLDTGNQVPYAAESVRAGRAVYEELKCGECHGETGRGDGPAAAGLLDSQGRPTRTTDLTQGWTYKGGTSPEATFLRFMSGMDGTPMPSFADAIALEDSVAAIRDRIEGGEPVSAGEREAYERGRAAARARLWHLANYMTSLAEEEGLLHRWFLGDTEVAK